MIDDSSNAGVALVVRRMIRADPARVFEAWTQASQLVKWWGPRGVTCIGAEVDLRVGGVYRIGNKLPDGSELWIVGEFEEIEAPQKLVYSWGFDGRTTPQERVTVRFEPRGEATEVIIVHECIADDVTRAGHEAGWSGCLDGLERVIVAR